VNQTIDEILRDHTAKADLWSAAFCYAFVRAVYGYVDPDAEGGHMSRNYGEARKQSAYRAQLMLAGLKGRNKATFPHFKEFIPLLETACEKGAFLGHLHVRAKKDSARVLTGMRFFTAYRLFYESIPKSWRIAQ
jgi:hypothetical protein